MSAELNHARAIARRFRALAEQDSSEWDTDKLNEVQDDMLTMAYDMARLLTPDGHPCPACAALEANGGTRCSHHGGADDDLA